MKNKLIKLSIALVAFLCSCQHSEISSTSSDSSYSNSNPERSSSISESDISSSSPSSSSSSSEDSSTTPVSKCSPISEVQKIAEGLTNTNEVGVATSGETYKIKGTIIANLVTGTTKKGYGNQFVFLVMDETDSIYVQVDDVMREKLASQVLKGSEIEFTGFPSLYRNSAQLIANEYEILNSSAPYSQRNIATHKNSISEIYEEIDKLTPNCKGTNFGNLFSFKALCYHKFVVSDNNTIFLDNNRSILVYDNNKLMNRLVEGMTYELIGAVQIYQFRPSFVLTEIKEEVEDSDIRYETYLNNSLIEGKNNADFYAQQPKSDLDGNSYETYPKYRTLYGDAYKVEGYLNLVNTSSGFTLTFSAESKLNIYSSLSAAGKDQALIFNNGSETGLKSEKDDSHSVLLPYYLEEQKVTMILYPYEYRNGYFKVEADLTSVEVRA